MDKKEFSQKSEKIINETFETVKKYAKIVAEKTGEAANVTKLLIQEATLEHQIAKAYSRLGHEVYDKSVHKGEAIDLEAEELKSIVEEIKKLDQQHDDIEKVLAKERSKEKAEKPKVVRKKKTQSST